MHLLLLMPRSAQPLRKPVWPAFQYAAATLTTMAMLTEDRSLPVIAHLSALSRSARFAWLKPTGSVAGFGVAVGEVRQLLATLAAVEGAPPAELPVLDFEHAAADRATSAAAETAAMARVFLLTAGP